MSASTAASQVYKSKTVWVQADGPELCNDMLFSVAAATGALLFAHPYASQQSPVLQDCLSLFSAITPPPADAHPTPDSCDLSLAHSKHYEQQLRDAAGQAEDPAQINANLVDQQSSNAPGDQRHGPSLPEHISVSHRQQSSY